MGDSPAVADAAPDSPTRRARVLLAEDASSLGWLFKDALVRAGLDVKHVPSADAALAAYHRSRPDLLVLDDCMRGPGATAVLAALAELDEPPPPILVMSVRARRAGDQLLELGASECLAKPFPTGALVARCRFLLSGSDTDSDVDTAPFLAAIDEQEREPSRRTPHPILTMVGAALRRALADLLQRGPEAMPDPGAVEAIDEVAAALARDVLNDDGLRAVLPAVDAVLEGDLRGVSILQVLQLLAAEQQTGVLDVESGAGRAELFLSDGRLDLAVLPAAPEPQVFAKVLAASGACDLETARSRLDRLDPTRPLVPQALDEGLVRLPELRRAATDTTRRALFDVLRWRDGRFSFGPARRLSSLVADIGLSLGLDELLVEGSAQIEDWHVIEKRLPDPSAVFVRDEDRLLPAILERLSAEERQVLDLVDGRTPLDAILDAAELPSYDVQSLLYRLLTLGLVRHRTRPVTV